MALSQETRDKLGYTRHADDVDNICFYCESPLDKNYYDYVPPRDVKANPELAALVNVPFVYVTTCHPCKTALYPNRYLLKTPEDRRFKMQSRRTKNRVNVDDIKRQLILEAPKPWQTYSIDANNSKTVIDRPDFELTEEVAAQKAEWVAAQNFAVAQTSEQIAPRTEDVLDSGPKRDVQGAPDIDLGF